VNLKTNLALVLVALSLAACETVTSPVPLGEKPATLDAGQWEGRWANADGYLDLVVTDAANGLVRIAYDDVEEGECKEMQLQLRTSGEWTFFSVTEEDFERSEGLASAPCRPVGSGQSELESAAVAPGAEPAPTRYMWGRVRLADNAIYAWGPEPKAFVRLVSAGRLPGTVDEGSVVLGPLGAEHYALIISGSEGVVLDWEDPLVLYRKKPAAAQ
jgi:hypothetical protein